MKSPFKPVLFFIIVLSAGCSITPKSPAVHDFGASKTNHDSRPAAKADITVDAPKWLMDNRIRYRLLYESPTQVRFYTLDRWIAPPTELLKQQLETLNHPLAIRLLDFEQQFDSFNQAKVLLRFSVEAYSSDHKKKLGSQEFRFERLTNTPDAIGAVTAFSELARQATDRIQIWLSELSEQ
jgi:cholesterol transport system auxiliary component